MKKVLIAAALVAIATSAAAREPQRGYRGFVEWSNDVTSYRYDEDTRASYWYTGLSTSHGYQFNPRLFVGAGLMLEHSTSGDLDILPIYAQIRTDQTWGKFTPYGDFKLGYNTTDGGGIYASPSIGYRFNWGKKLNLNVGVGLTLKGYAVERYSLSFTPPTISDQDAYVTLDYLGTDHKVKAMFAFRIGIDF
jgi:outer membrane protein assembly factor BamA